MSNIRFIQKFLQNGIRFLMILPVSLLVGLGANQVVQWIGYPEIQKNQILMVGILLLMSLYVIPKFITYLIALIKIRRYFPITNEVIREYRQFFLENINQEITHLQNTVAAFRERGMQDDYNLFYEGLLNMQEIKSRIITNEDLQQKHLKHLNQVFNRGFLIKKL